MRTLSISTLITYSIDRTNIILFKPFSLKKWLCLLFIAWLCGALGGGGGNFGGNYNDVNRKQANAAQLQPLKVHGNNIQHLFSSLNLQGISGHKPVWHGRDVAAIVIAGLVVLFVVSFFVALLLVLVWLGAKFKFIWFNAMVANDASIAEPFKRYHKEGNSLFLFSIVFLSIMIVFVLLIAIWVFAIGTVTGIFASEPEWSIMNILTTFFIPGLVLLAGILVAAVFGVYIDHFVVPIMALDNCRFIQAWRRFVGLFKENAGDFILYIFVLMGLGIVCGIIVFFAALICIVTLFLAAAIIFGIPYLLIVALLKAKVLFIILAVLLAIPFIAVAVLLLASINLPVAVFFRSFSLYFLSSLNVGYTPLQLTPGSEQS